MLKKLPLIFLVLLSVPCCFSQENEQTGPVLSFEIPSQNLLRYNRYLVHPAFSALGPVNTYIGFHHRNQWAEYDNSPEVYLANFSGKINERTGFGLGLFQQGLGVIDNFGLLANYAYGIQVADYSTLTFGVNVAYYRSGINWGSVFASDNQDPALQNMENSSLIAFHPGLNLSFHSFDVGVYAENIVNFNLTNYESYISGNSGKIFSAHVMHTLKMETLSGVFEDGEMTTMLRGRKTGEDFFPGASLIVNFPRLGWLQAGYDDLYGAAAGVGFNLTSHLSLGYTVEKGLSENIANFGTTHEFSLSYAFKPSETPPRHIYTKRKRPAVRPRLQKPVVSTTAGTPEEKREEKTKNPSGETISQTKEISEKAVASTAQPPAVPQVVQTQEKDSVKLQEQKKSGLGHQQLGDTRLTAERRRQIKDSIDQAEKAEEIRLALAKEEEPVKDTLTESKTVVTMSAIQNQGPDIEDLLFEAAAKQENIRTQTATLMDVEDGYYIIANVFKSESNLNKYINTLRNKGWKAGSFKNPENDLNYVYVKQYDTWEEAINQRKKHARELNNSGVWVFRVKNAKTVLAKMESQKIFGEMLMDSIKVAQITPQIKGNTKDSDEKSVLNLPLAGGEIRSAVKNTYIPVDIIESVPVFPGCEDLRNNEERKACLANGIDKVIQRRFRASVATGLGLSGIQGVYVEFKVGTDGEVSVLRIRAPHKRLEEEARRVISHIPKMRPGRQGNTPVDVMYSKAIIIKIE
ncbi:PorP/SprF family type IX secretion system membrane protein [Sinomicrobium sp. M5D2P17]